MRGVQQCLGLCMTVSVDVVRGLLLWQFGGSFETAFSAYIDHDWQKVIPAACTCVRFYNLSRVCIFLSFMWLRHAIAALLRLACCSMRVNHTHRYHCFSSWGQSIGHGALIRARKNKNQEMAWACLVPDVYTSRGKKIKKNILISACFRCSCSFAKTLVRCEPGSCESYIRRCVPGTGVAAEKEQSYAQKNTQRRAAKGLFPSLPIFSGQQTSLFLIHQQL
jgi:hypothetical protein